MLPGFAPIECEQTFRKLWRQVADKVEVLHCNLSEVMSAKEAGMPVPELIVHWGCKAKESDKMIVLAISKSAQGKPDMHWISPILAMFA